MKKLLIPNDYQYQFVVLAAFRYAVGRRSYAVDLIQRWIEENIKTLEESTIDTMIKDLNEIFARCERTKNYSELGHASDRDSWAEFMKTLFIQKEKLCRISKKKSDKN